MRKLVGLASVLCGALCFAAVATAGEATSPSGQIQTLDVAHQPNKTSKSKRKPRGTKIKVTLTLARTDGTKPSPTTGVRVHLPKGMILNYRKFKACDLRKLTSNGPKACPRGSKVGRGTLKADASPVLPEVGGTVTAYNGTKRTLLLYIVPEISSPLVIPGKLKGSRSKQRLDFQVPLVPTLPGQPNATLTYFQVTVGATAKTRKRVRGKRRTVRLPYIGNATRCIDRSYPWRFDFTYENGEQLRPTEAAPCTR